MSDSETSAGPNPILVGGTIGEALAEGPIASRGETLTLTMEDLIPDARGEIVILNETGQDIAVVTADSIAAHGVESSHTTALGMDVSGFSYCTFASGLTIFYPSSQRLLITDHV